MIAARKIVVDLRARAHVWRIPERLEHEIAQAAPAGWTVEIVTTETVSDGDGGHPPTSAALAAVAEAEVYYGYGITPALWAAAKQLRWVHTATAGVGSSLFPELLASDVILTNSAGVHAVPIAEHVVGGLLYFWRGFDLTQQAQNRGQWDRDAFVSVASPLREVGENTVVILGTGGIGSEVAARLSTLGATCIGVRRRPKNDPPAGFARMAGRDQLDELLPRADALVLSVPLTASTRGLIGGARLDLLPPHAVLVNVARGPVVDERALAERLSAGRLRGAVLDVFHREPLAPDSPLWPIRRALITPHISAITPRRFWDRQAALFLDNCRRYAAGTPLRNVVNKHAGY